ncbi:hypothetical protein [Amycolatopsis sp. NPDC004625]|uniref:hypothetical protein n=1 Tax=Amycolatopsis sp. NPDC004625 TaxID=3154670 RepID=UPI0033B5FDCE
MATLLSDLTRLEAVERRLRAVPGNGRHDVRLGYLWMLASTDEQVKPDRKVLGWLSRRLGHQVDVLAARRLLADAAELGRTPWELDHAI